MELFPLFLKLEGRRCLVVGAGRIAAPKIESLLRCGAKVRVVAPQALPRVRKAAGAGRLVWEQREFRDADLSGSFLVVAATSHPALHQRIFQLAQRAGILCNSVDEPSRCDFYYPAVVRRGPLQIAISTGGNSPALAKRLRLELAVQFGPEYASWVGEIGKARACMMAPIPPGAAAPAPPDGRSRKAALVSLASARSFRRFSRGPRSARKAAAQKTAAPPSARHQALGQARTRTRAKKRMQAQKRIKGSSRA